MLNDKSKIAKSVASPVLIYQYVKDVFPLVKLELSRWSNLASQIPDLSIREQALASIYTKSFHCLGGSIYALYPGANILSTIEFIVAYQTISDFLDNLVDSLQIEDEKAFYQLHLAMQEALKPDPEISNYYCYYPYKDDGGYLETLVRTCKANIANLLSYSLIKEDVLELAIYYSKLQTYKHLAKSERETKMLEWIAPHLQDYPDVSPWEFAAATGSTLGIFCLYSCAFNPFLTKEQVEKIKQTYFPWICALHILLDYFIDLQEDKDTGQLNFVQYYDNQQTVEERLQLFYSNSFFNSKKLPYANFHIAVIKGLLAMYLSDEKTRNEEIKSITKRFIKSNGTGVRVLYWICCRLRKRKML